MGIPPQALSGPSSSHPWWIHAQGNPMSPGMNPFVVTDSPKVSTYMHPPVSPLKHDPAATRPTLPMPPSPAGYVASSPDAVQRKDCLVRVTLGAELVHSENVQIPVKSDIGRVPSPKG